jgi:hypothetical protein
MGHMSTEQLKSVIAREIDRVNDRIEMKIVKGRPYSREARHHRVLLMRLREIERQRYQGGRMTGVWAFAR